MTHQELENLQDEFFQKLTATHLGTHLYPKTELSQLFQKVCTEITVDHPTYRKFIGRFLYVLERNDQTSIVVLIDSFFIYYARVLEIKDFEELNEEILNGRVTAQVEEKFFKAYEQSITYGQGIRLSEFNFNKALLTQEDKLEIISYLDSVITEATNKLEWDNHTVQSVLMFLPALRDLLKDQGNTYLFFIITAMILDRFASSEYYQQARDFAEEIIITSYLDGRPYLGYFNSFRCYSNNSSVIPAMLYGNLSFASLLRKNTRVPQHFVKEIIWQGIKYFRNVSMFHWVHVIYKSIPRHIVFNAYEKRSLTHSYLSSLMPVGDAKLPSLLLDFLHENREEIYMGGIKEATPWLITLYNVKRIYPGADFSATGLGHYLTTFEDIVPADHVATQKAIILGDLGSLKSSLKVSLIKLNETRSATDVVHDNEQALKIADRIVGEAVPIRDFDAILLAMLIKADYSFIFSEKARKEIAEVNIPNKDNATFEQMYGSESAKRQRLLEIENYSFLWLFTAETRWYYLMLSQRNFLTNELPEWKGDAFQELIHSGFFSGFTFDDTIKSQYEVRTILPEEHVHQTDKLKAVFSFTKIEQEVEQPLLVINDVLAAGFPHNLLLDRNKEFISNKQPICNVISTEWYLKYGNGTLLSKEFSRAIWIPTDGGDFTLAQLHSKLENYLFENRFNTVQSLTPKSPISADLNIVSAHGAEDIALKQVIYPDANPRLNLDAYLGPGKVLILFVCHSGSLKSTPFKNSISSIVKQYISKGYMAVVAPYWSLHIDIPPIWLPVFISALQNGDEILQAVHKANQAVGMKYPTITAWLCMHLYGDPHIRIGPA